MQGQEIAALAQDLEGAHIRALKGELLASAAVHEAEVDKLSEHVRLVERELYKSRRDSAAQVRVSRASAPPLLLHSRRSLTLLASAREPCTFFPLTDGTA